MHLSCIYNKIDNECVNPLPLEQNIDLPGKGVDLIFKPCSRIIFKPNEHILSKEYIDFFI